MYFLLIHKIWFFLLIDLVFAFHLHFLTAFFLYISYFTVFLIFLSTSFFFSFYISPFFLTQLFLYFLILFSHLALYFLFHSLCVFLLYFLSQISTLFYSRLSHFIWSFNIFTLHSHFSFLGHFLTPLSLYIGIHFLFSFSHSTFSLFCFFSLLYSSIKLSYSTFSFPGFILFSRPLFFLLSLPIFHSSLLVPSLSTLSPLLAFYFLNL